MQFESVTDAQRDDDGKITRPAQMVFKHDKGYRFEAWQLTGGRRVPNRKNYDSAHVPIEEGDVSRLRRAQRKGNDKELLEIIRKYLPPPGGPRHIGRSVLYGVVHHVPEGTTLRRGHAHYSVQGGSFGEYRNPAMRDDIESDLASEPADLEEDRRLTVGRVAHRLGGIIDRVLRKF